MSSEDEAPSIHDTRHLISEMTEMQNHYDKIISDLQNEIMALNEELDNVRRACPNCESIENERLILRYELDLNRKAIKNDMNEVLNDHSLFHRLFTRS